MSGSLLERVKKLNQILQDSDSGDLDFDELCAALSELMDSNVYVISRKGRYLGTAMNTAPSGPQENLSLWGGEDSFSKIVNDEFLKINESLPNMTKTELVRVFQEDYDDFARIHTIIPIQNKRERFGTILITRAEPEYDEEDMVLAEYGAAVVGLAIKKNRAIEQAAEAREKEIVQIAMSTLSYSEAEAAIKIFDELEGEEGLLVASRIADKSGITRSVIVNSLRKLESAGVIESRSLGMKGTYIKIVNSKFKEELAKLDKTFSIY